MKRFLKSFKYAFAGLWYCVRRERNFRVHLVAMTIVIALMVIFELERYEMIALIFAICFVLFAEMVNTAVERAVDNASTEYTENGKVAKDVAAGAVLISAIFAATVGFIVFGERILEVIR
ncbi:MAG: diacylglycerol kinase family protein [Oscillospiraceae bacterium]|nr:diacylglycerol kinase family protein [Oscillospiraceae bacterium]